MGDFSICFSEHLTGHPNKQISFLSDRLRIDHQDKNHLKNKYLHVLIFQKHRVHDQTDDT